jgi:hypothetical protein
MKTEVEIREMLVVVDAFGSEEPASNVLRWVLDEYPPKSVPTRSQQVADASRTDPND